MTLNDTAATRGRDRVISLARVVRDAGLATTTLIAEVDMRAGQELAPLGDDPSLADRAASINKHIDLYSRAADRAHTYRLRAGRELIEARKHVPHGEWITWCDKNIKRGMRDIQKLMQMAGAPDPDAELALERSRARNGMAALRANTSNVTRISSPPIIEGECVDVTPVEPSLVPKVSKKTEVAAAVLIAVAEHLGVDLKGVIDEMERQRPEYEALRPGGITSVTADHAARIVEAPTWKYSEDIKKAKASVERCLARDAAAA